MAFVWVALIYIAIGIILSKIAGLIGCKIGTVLELIFQEIKDIYSLLKSKFR